MWLFSSWLLFNTYVAEECFGMFLESLQLTIVKMESHWKLSETQICKNERSWESSNNGQLTMVKYCRDFTSPRLLLTQDLLMEFQVSCTVEKGHKQWSSILLFDYLQITLQTMLRFSTFKLFSWPEFPIQDYSNHSTRSQTFMKPFYNCNYRKSPYAYFMKSLKFT